MSRFLNCSFENQYGQIFKMGELILGREKLDTWAPSERSNHREDVSTASRTPYFIWRMSRSFCFLWTIWERYHTCGDSLRDVSMGRCQKGTVGKHGKREPQDVQHIADYIQWQRYIGFFLIIYWNVTFDSVSLWVNFKNVWKQIFFAIYEIANLV